VKKDIIIDTNIPAKEIETGVLPETVEISNSKLTTGNNQSEFILHFQKQQENNLKIKEAMAEELRDMELPEYIVNEILNIEDEPPF
jgi:hypothetical protein